MLRADTRDELEAILDKIENDILPELETQVDDENNYEKSIS